MDAEYLLSAIERGDYAEPGEAMGALAVAVVAINREIADGHDEGRIQQLVDRLHKAAAYVAKRSHAGRFSISVGFPMGVSVSVEWDAEPDS